MRALSAIAYLAILNLELQYAAQRKHAHCADAAHAVAVHSLLVIADTHRLLVQAARKVQQRADRIHICAVCVCARVWAAQVDCASQNLLKQAPNRHIVVVGRQVFEKTQCARHVAQHLRNGRVCGFEKEGTFSIELVHSRQVRARAVRTTRTR